MHKLSAHRATIYWVLVVLIFFIPYVSGCGGSGSGVSMETFPGSNVKLDGTVDWNKVFTTKDQTVTAQCFGGYYSDVGHCIRPTHDGGFIVAGSSQSTDGDLQTSGNHGGGDVWIIKFSSGGTIEWQKCYGGSDFDCAYSVQETKTDSSTYDGYVFAGVTRSHDGDVQSRKDKTATDNDMWIAKIDTQGALVWEKYIDGVGSESIRSVWQANDGGYVIAAGYNGEAYVAKLKFDNTGSPGDSPSLKWSKIIGGSGVDWAGSVQQTSDGGYVIAGYTSSTSGTGISGNHGGYDALVVKLVEDETGSSANIEWSRCLGGSYGDEAYSVQQTSDGGYVIAGETKSNNGDINGNNPYNYDCCWVVKLDETGNTVLMQNCINNGLYGCYGSAVQQTSDGGYVVTGNAYYSGNTYNCYVAKLNGAGELVWAKSPGGSGPDYGYSVCEVTGNYLVAGETYSTNSGATGYHDGGDVFLIKIADQATPPPQSLTIVNAKADPEKFNHLKKDASSNISAQITTTSGTTSPIYWVVTVKKGDTVLKTFQTRNGAPGSGPWNVSESWDGKNNIGNYVDFDKYTFSIDVTSASGNAEANATGPIVVAPPFPEISGINFDQKLALNLIDDEGRKIEPIYYKKKGNGVVQNPVAIPLSLMPDAPLTVSATLNRDTTSSVDKELLTEIELYNPEVYHNLPDYFAPIKWHIEITDDEDKALKFVNESDKVITFGPGINSKTALIPLKFDRIREIDWIKASYYWEKDPQEYKRITTECSILMPLNVPVDPPIKKSEDGKINTGLLDIACHLVENTPFTQDPEIAEAAVRTRMESGLYYWLKTTEFQCKRGNTYISKEFYYDPGETLYFKYDKKSFDYANFIYPIYGPSPDPTPYHPERTFYGSCESVSAFYELLCAAVGVDVGLKRMIALPEGETFTTSMVSSCGYYERSPITLNYEIAQARIWPFSIHQFASVSDYLIFDPTLFFQINFFAAGIPFKDFTPCYKTDYLLHRTATQPYIDEISEYHLQSVKWPDKKSWWHQ